MTYCDTGRQVNICVNYARTEATRHELAERDGKEAIYGIESPENCAAEKLLTLPKKGCILPRQLAILDGTYLPGPTSTLDFQITPLGDQNETLFVVLSLLAVIAMVTAVYAGIRNARAGMQVRFNRRDLPQQGVQIITPLDETFAATASKYFKGVSANEDQPFSVFIKNSTNKVVVAYALTWEFANSDGKVMSNTIAYSEPGILMGDEIPKDLKHTTAILPDEVRCFSWDSQIMPEPPAQANFEQVRGILENQLSKTTDLTVSLEGAVFDDGTFVGSNLVFFEQMKAVVNAKVDLLREIAIGSQRKQLDQAFAKVKARSQEPEITLGSKFSADEYYRYYQKIYASEIAAMTDAYGKEALVPHLVRSYLRAKPIKIEK